LTFWIHMLCVKNIDILGKNACFGCKNWLFLRQKKVKMWFKTALAARGAYLFKLILVKVTKESQKIVKLTFWLTLHCQIRNVCFGVKTMWQTRKISKIYKNKILLLVFYEKLLFCKVWAVQKSTVKGLLWGGHPK
jgi:hypothetical protein